MDGIERRKQGGLNREKARVCDCETWTLVDKERKRVENRRKR